jgi:hypothetical protein
VHLTATSTHQLLLPAAAAACCYGLLVLQRLLLLLQRLHVTNTSRWSRRSCLAAPLATGRQSCRTTISSSSSSSSSLRLLGAACRCRRGCGGAQRRT